MFKKYKNILITVLLILLVVVLDFLYCNYKTINHLNTKSIFNETKLIENDLYKKYSVSLNNFGTTAPSNGTTNKLLNLAIDASGNVYVQARAT